MAKKQDTPHGSLGVLVLGSLGVVFGDIGTSPLYTIQECVGPRGVPAEPANVLGILSLIIWSLFLVVTLKYVIVLMNADNRGEGGIMALLALVPSEQRQVVAGRIGWVTLMVLAGSALLFGDGIITPAISVLSAMEGLEVADPALKPLVVPATAGILLALFLIQSRGTGTLGKLFGPIMVVWFCCILVLGAVNITNDWHVLAAFSPHYGLWFLCHHGWHGFTLLGSVVLAVTGGEALYADMGHFGRKPIRLSWTFMVFPALICCYMGQGALLLQHPDAHQRPFYNMLPTPALRYAMVVLAAAATVIASQGLISAVFSMTHQAMRLGYFPRLAVRHTSSEVEGQIYVPLINWFLAIACLILVLVFRESNRLAAAFGLAVSGTMGLTSVIFFEVSHRTWGWSRLKAGALLLLFLSFDIPFFVATSVKFLEGGYIPFLVGLLAFVVMVLWTKGRSLLAAHRIKNQLALGQIKELVRQPHLIRTPGTGIYLSYSSHHAPAALSLQLDHFHSLPQKLVFLTVLNESVPYASEEGRVKVTQMDDDIWSVLIHCGFMEMPDVGSAVQALPAEVVESATYFVGRETFAATNKGMMPGWQESIFAFLVRNTMDVSLYFNLPPDRVVELGSRLDL